MQALLGVKRGSARATGTTDGAGKGQKTGNTAHRGKPPATVNLDATFSAFANAADTLN